MHLDNERARLRGLRRETPTVSVPLQTVPDNQDSGTDGTTDETVSQANHEAAEIIARARRQAEAIVAEARSQGMPATSPLAALGDNAEEIIGQVRKLIKKQRQLQTERQSMVDEINALKSERDELVHRLTDAVVRMEELAALADTAQQGPAPAQRSRPTAPPRAEEPARPETRKPVAPKAAAAPEEDTSLAARLKRAEEAEMMQDDTSLAARLRRAEQAEAVESPDAKLSGRAARMAQNEENMAAAVAAERAAAEVNDDEELFADNDGRSFYDRHSAKLPRLEGDGGRSVLSAMGGMRPEPDSKGRKGRRRKK